MTDNQTQKYAQHLKMAWRIYAVFVVLLAIVLVVFVASDNEERFFFGFMTIAGSYAFRPTERFMSNQILKYTGVSKPEEKE